MNLAFYAEDRFLESHLNVHRNIMTSFLAAALRTASTCAASSATTTEEVTKYITKIEFYTTLTICAALRESGEIKSSEILRIEAAEATLTTETPGAILACAAHTWSS